MGGGGEGKEGILQTNSFIPHPRRQNKNPSGARGAAAFLGGLRLETLANTQSISDPRTANCPCRSQGATAEVTGAGGDKGTGLRLGDTGLCCRTHTLHLGQDLKYNSFEVSDLKNVISEMKPKKCFVLFF